MNRPVHVINIEIKDNHEEALIAGKAMLDLCTAVRRNLGRQWSDALNMLVQIEAATNLDEEIDEIVAGQLQQHSHEILHTIAFY